MGSTTTAKSSSSSVAASPLLLFSIASFTPRSSSSNSNSNSSNSSTKANSTNGVSTTATTSYVHPPFQSCLVSGLLFVAFLVLCEQAGRYGFSLIQDWHPLLANATNRHILARHFCVDSVSCFLCAGLGWACRHESLYPVLRGTIPVAGFEQRLFSYSPAAFRLTLVFFWYQVKNLVDTILWNDGPEFIFHHIFSMITAWGSMTPGCGHMYGMFFFGLSEVSTAVLTALANFDDKHGVLGLGQALPLTKVILAVVFTILFIVCRCIVWPMMSYYFCRDIWHALQSCSHDPRARRRRVWMIFFLVSLSSLSVLQVAWLGQIFVLGRRELVALGFLES